MHSDYSCLQCGEAFTTKKDINKHKETEHDGKLKGFVYQKEKGVCKFYKQGRCNRQMCTFKHPKSLDMVPHHKQFTPACTRGTNCFFLLQNNCHYFHPGVGVQLPRMQGQQQISQHWGKQQHSQRGRQQQHLTIDRRQQGQETIRRQKRCHFQLRCINRQNCEFIHEDFSMSQDFQENY